MYQQIYCTLKGGQMPFAHEKEPRSWAIQQYFHCRPKIAGKKVSTINPQTKHEINKYYINIPVIGLTTKETPDQAKAIGFDPVAPVISEVSNNPEEDMVSTKLPIYTPEAYIHLDISDMPLPKGLTGEIWVLQIIDHKDHETYTDIAKALCSQFPDVTILITTVFKKICEDDSVEGIPIFPGLIHSDRYCPIGISNITDISDSIKSK
jgi:hypothetical protein